MHGDWHLALASYNWGEGAVKRAITKNEARGLPTDYPSLTMPNETRHYVPKLQALKNIFGNPALIARLGPPSNPNEPYFATLETIRDNLENSHAPLTQWQAYTVTSAERLAQIANRFDTTASELARVNGLSGNVRLGAGSTLLVPGNGLGLRNLLSAPAPQHIIEPERSARACGKAGKRGAKPCAKAEMHATGKPAASPAKSGKAHDKAAA